MSQALAMARIFCRNVRIRWRELVDRTTERWRGQRFKREHFNRIFWK